MSGGDKHEETLALLRQISIGLGVYRLYPDEVERPDFLEAVRRVQSAAEQALRSGTVDVEIHADQLSTPAGPLPNTQLLGRLALCCYERGIERLQVRRAPILT